MKQIIIVLFIALSVNVSGQNSYYSNPVKIPMLLSGSFAELRNNHFHSGIDIKTQGVTGIPVYSVADGFISRIVVSPTGFGKAIYIDHPNGTTSVYGHLKSFRDDINEYVKNIQYEKKTFRVDLQIPENQFKIKQEEFIASSGNTGSSGGPHLHFEIRDTQTEEPLNPLNLGFPVKDNIAPKIYSLMVVPLGNNSHTDYKSSKKSYPVVFHDDAFHLNHNPIIPVYGNIGFAIQTNDFFDESNNRCGVYSIQLKIDGELYYSFKMDRFAFSESRYINSHIDYAEYQRSRRRFHKTWIDPGNKLSIYETLKNDGILEVNEEDIHHVRIELTDTYGNISVLEFNIEGKPEIVPAQETAFIRTMIYNNENHFRSGGIKADFPENAFYTDIPFTYTKKTGRKKFYSDIHVVHNESTPIHASSKLSIDAENIPEDLKSKALLVKVDTTSGKFYSAGGEYKFGWVTGNIRSFGNYAVAVDTVPPKVVGLSLRNNSELSESSGIRFRIS
ncbi:MAG TPA: M23 family metallopeptidase, partial [Tangfeifania sp.]|nr:M23 family metallopeptidase [Tangfeifania sp.]